MNPQEIERTEFETSFRGYDKPEVRNFLRRLAREIGDLQAELSSATPTKTGATPEPVQPPPPAPEMPESPASESESPESEVAAPAEPTPAEPATDGSTPTEPAIAEIDTGIEPVLTGEPIEVNEVISDVEVIPASQSLKPRSGDDNDERFQALGDRIADLLKSAHQSAAHLSEMAEVEVSEKIALADAEGDAIRAEAEGDANKIREAALAEAHELRSRSEQDAELVLAASEMLQAKAETKVAEAEELKQNAYVAGTEELRVQREEVDELTDAAFADREMALSELGDARSQVTDLLGEARTQSEFLRHEAEEIIRARVRKNIEEAEERLNVLRNSEIASRSRILAAREELEGAISRLDIEEAPALPSDPETFALTGAQERADVSDYGAIEADYSTLDGDLPEVEAGEQFADPTGLPQRHSSTSESDPVLNGVSDVETADDEVIDVEVTEVETADVEVIEVDVLEPATGSDFVDSPVDGTSEDDGLIEASSVETADTSQADEITEAPVTQIEIDEVAETPAIEDEVVEPPIAEPIEAIEAETTDTKAPEAYEPATPEDSTEASVEVEPADEDALGRLVRQAMEQAVDSARSSDR